MRYDDMEVPNIITLRDRYYLIASIREDVKVHYWYADTFKGPYHNFSDNVLLPQGNYAARISREEDGRYLVWNFFFKGLTTKGEHLMAPPKELVVNPTGQLQLKTFRGFDTLITNTLTLSDLVPLQPLFHNPHASGATEDVSCWFGCESGFEMFLLQGEYRDFMLSGELNLEGRGKCGLVFRLNDEGDGYYLSLELFKGIAQIRAWGHKPHGTIEEAFHYDQLQAAYYEATSDPHPFCLVAYEQYLEFSLNNHILLTLADDQFQQGKVGFYVESARIRLDHLQLKVCTQPSTESYPGNIANY
jgi:beta-fructofuranosidase